MNPREVMEWAKNLAKQNSTKAELMQAAKRLGLDLQAVDRRYEHAGIFDLESEKGVYFILTGEKHPRGGYAWASEVLKIAKELVSSRPAKADMFATMLGKVQGVKSAVVNDFAVVSHTNDGVPIYEVDVHVYVDPVVGGTLTNTLKAATKRTAQMVGVILRDFWTPRADRSVADIGIGGLVNFYRENPYKVIVTCEGDTHP